MRAFEGATPSRTAIGGTNDKARAVIGDKDKVVGAKWDSHPLTRGDSIFASPGWIVMGNVMSIVEDKRMTWVGERLSWCDRERLDVIARFTSEGASLMRVHLKSWRRK